MLTIRIDSLQGGGGGQMAIIDDERDEEITRREADRLERLRKVSAAIMKDAGAYYGALAAGLIFPWEAGKRVRHLVDLSALREFLAEAVEAGVISDTGEAGVLVWQVLDELKKWQTGP